MFSTFAVIGVDNVQLPLHIVYTTALHSCGEVHRYNLVYFFASLPGTFPDCPLTVVRSNADPHFDGCGLALCRLLLSGLLHNRCSWSSRLPRMAPARSS